MCPTHLGLQRLDLLAQGLDLVLVLDGAEAAAVGVVGGAVVQWLGRVGHHPTTVARQQDLRVALAETQRTARGDLVMAL